MSISYCLYHIVYIILSISYCHYHIVNIILSISYCQYHIVNTILSTPYCQYHIINIILLISYCQYHIVTIILSISYCQYHIINTLLSIPYCQYHTVNIISIWYCQYYIVIMIMSLWYCKYDIVTMILLIWHCFILEFLPTMWALTSTENCSAICICKMLFHTIFAYIWLDETNSDIWYASSGHILANNHWIELVLSTLNLSWFYTNLHPSQVQTKSKLGWIRSKFGMMFIWSFVIFCQTQSVGL